MPARADVLLTCDQIIIDAVSGKKTLVGLFDLIAARGFPVQHPRFFAYARFNGAPHQQVLVTWRVVGPSSLIAEVPTAESRLSAQGSGDAVVELGGLLFPEPGEYRIIVRVNDEDAGITKLHVNLMETRTASDPTVH